MEWEAVLVMEKFCKDCKFSSYDDEGMNILCEHPKNYVEFFNHAHYLATGEKLAQRMVKRAATAHILRMPRGPAANVCGPDAEWYEDK